MGVSSFDWGVMSGLATQANAVPWDRSNPQAARLAIRTGAYTGYTAGIAPGCVQANVCILPRALAEDFLLYCQRNPKPCPLIARSDLGDPRLPTLAEDLDIRTDIPRYHIFRDGEFVEEVTDITTIGATISSPSRSAARSRSRRRLLASGLRLRFLERNDVAGVYMTKFPPCRRGPSRAADGDDARVQAGRRHPRHPDHLALSQRARRAGAHRHAGGHRRRSQPALPGCRRPRGRRRRTAGVLGLRAHAATRREERKAAALHHARAVLDADHGPAERLALQFCSSPMRDFELSGRSEALARGSWPQPRIRLRRSPRSTSCAAAATRSMRRSRRSPCSASSKPRRPASAATASPCYMRAAKARSSR